MDQPKHISAQTVFKIGDFTVPLDFEAARCYLCCGRRLWRKIPHATIRCSLVYVLLLTNDLPDFAERAPASSSADAIIVACTHVLCPALEQVRFSENPCLEPLLRASAQPRECV